MKITLYSNFSKKINSTKQPTGGSDKSVVLKENTSLMNPVFILDEINFEYNYCKWNNRYYYINDVVVISNSHAEYHCSVDVLASYKSDIGSSSQYILRSSSSFDRRIIDTLYPVKQQKTLKEINLTTLHANFTTGFYVVGIVDSSSNNSGAITYYSMTASTFKSFLSFMFSGTTYLEIDPEEISEGLQKALINPFQYIKSCMWYPFAIGGTSSNVKFGWWESDIIAEIIPESSRQKLFSQTATLTEHPQASVRGEFLNGSPFRRLQLNIYNFGSIPIDASYFIDNQTIVVGTRCDVFTGIGEVYITDGVGTIIYKQMGQMGVPVQISETSSNLIGSALNVVSGAVGLAYGNVVGFAQGVMSAIDTLMPQVQTQGMNGTSIAYVPVPKIIVESFTVANDSNTHNGRPLCTDRSISSLSGYVLCQDADISIAGTEQEKNQVVSFMNSGFFYE